MSRGVHYFFRRTTPQLLVKERCGGKNNAGNTRRSPCPSQPCSTRTLEPVAELGHTRDARIPGTVTPGTKSPQMSPCAIAPDPIAFEWTGVPGRAFLMQVKENTSDVEAALGTSQRLTETVFGRDLALLNGRRRGTKDFLGRGILSRSRLSRGQRPSRPTL
jgi:hypothetical protein